jgi:hypothetical protein
MVSDFCRDDVWTPAFAGVALQETFYKIIIFGGKEFPPVSGKSSTYELDIPLLKLHFCAQGERAERTKILVLIPVRKNEQQPLAYRHRLAAAGAEERTGFELAIGRWFAFGRTRATGRWLSHDFIWPL